MVPEDLRDVCGPALGTLRLLLDAVRAMIDDGIFIEIEEKSEATVTASSVDGTGIPATQGWSLT